MNYLLALFVAFLAFITNAQDLTSSNLPIMKINYTGWPVDSAWTEIIVNMGIIDNTGKRNYISDPSNNYDGKIKIKVQGSSSVQWPKRSYRITTINAFDQNYDAALMGFPA